VCGAANEQDGCIYADQNRLRICCQLLQEIHVKVTNLLDFGNDAMMAYEEEILLLESVINFWIWYCTFCDK
jgi:hypothetical protein